MSKSCGEVEESIFCVGGEGYFNKGSTCWTLCKICKLFHWFNGELTFVFIMCKQITAFIPLTFRGNIIFCDVVIMFLKQNVSK